MASSTLCKIHVNNSTGVSLNERFTAMSSQPKVTVGGRSRSRSVERSLPRVDHATTRANQRFLAELQRKHKLQAAMKLKRRSMRTVGVGGPGAAFGRIKRGSVKALRVGANGKPMRTNSLANIATMNADREVLNRRTTPLRRSNSSGSLSNRLGPRRPVVGGAAQRIARRMDRQRGGVVEKGGRSLTNGGGFGGRSRSRNRSLTRVNENGRSRSRSRNQNIGAVARGRSLSRSRNPMQARSRSRNRGREGASAKASLPIKARLGVRPGANVNVSQNNRRENRNKRGASITRRGVQTGRVQKSRNPRNRNAGIRAGGNINRPRSRSAIRNANEQQRPRSRSRTRKGQVGQPRGQGQVQRKDSGQTQQRGRGKVQQRGPGQAQQRGPAHVQQRRRGRSQQRRGVSNNAQKGSNNPKANSQQRRGRSRSRTGGRGGPRNQGKATKGTVNKDELDKELDQYMATTKTENDMDFLLKD